MSETDKECSLMTTRESIPEFGVPSASAARYEQQQSPDERAAYAAEEATTKAARIGLGTLLTPVPPWIYRKSNQDAIKTLYGTVLAAALDGSLSMPAAFNVATAK